MPAYEYAALKAKKLPFHNLGYPTFKTEVTVSDAEFDREYRTRVKTFVKRDHAIKFAYHCNLDTVTCPGL